MNAGKKPKIVLLGMMSKMPVAGNMWLVIQYLVGFRRLGYDPYDVEPHGITPTNLMRGEDDDGAARAAAFIVGGVAGARMSWFMGSSAAGSCPADLASRRRLDHPPQTAAALRSSPRSGDGAVAAGG